MLQSVPVLIQSVSSRSSATVARGSRVAVQSGSANLRGAPSGSWRLTSRLTVTFSQIVISARAPDASMGAADAHSHCLHLRVSHGVRPLCSAGNPGQLLRQGSDPVAPTHHSAPPIVPPVTAPQPPPIYPPGHDFE